MTEKEIERINFLARKSRGEGLTAEEKEEQRILRKRYVESVVGSLKSQLDNTTVIRPDGTSEKLSQKK